MNFAQIRVFLLLYLLYLPSSVFAFFCPTNFSQINYGNTIEQVTQTCGKPDRQETKVEKPPGPQEWNYYVPQTVATNGMYAPAQGTLKTQISFNSEGKVINISVNGIGVGSSTICGDMIQLGDTLRTIKNTCGAPAFVNRQSDLDNKQAADKITTFYFNNTTPPVQLIFKNGRLSEKRQGN